MFKLQIPIVIYNEFYSERIREKTPYFADWEDYTITDDEKNNYNIWNTYDITAKVLIITKNINKTTIDGDMAQILYQDEFLNKMSGNYYSGIDIKNNLTFEKFNIFNKFLIIERTVTEYVNYVINRSGDAVSGRDNMNRIMQVVKNVLIANYNTMMKKLFNDYSNVRAVKDSFLEAFRDCYSSLQNELWTYQNKIRNTVRREVYDSFIVHPEMAVDSTTSVSNEDLIEQQNQAMNSGYSTNNDNYNTVAMNYKQRWTLYGNESLEGRGQEPNFPAEFHHKNRRLRRGIVIDIQHRAIRRWDDFI